MVKIIESSRMSNIIEVDESFIRLHCKVRPNITSKFCNFYFISKCDKDGKLEILNAYYDYLIKIGKIEEPPIFSKIEFKISTHDIYFRILRSEFPTNPNVKINEWYNIDDVYNKVFDFFIGEQIILNYCYLKHIDELSYCYKYRNKKDDSIVEKLFLYEDGDTKMIMYQNCDTEEISNMSKEEFDDLYVFV